ncbi:hypothetical protein ACRE_046700 [Hapsidospora chrysogenum ATCC 11550]|uniref:Uncharacterized protein n=1 Tax=Hapsidospora chrysogenum (strain ATCC 11550 / CBS 779.69 / DSM 880 / IAM 14645 / JCM 23072 / IMI 49137) TaxID=857340 RepID=A0A086T5D6_HAPC1|nr:hypothetical protein ACRE_046700 [Hapsidospora chrysogenum ATCC 11550]
MEHNERRKRKRSSSVKPDSSLPSHLPPDSINPFSRSPGQLLQFSIAGLTDTDEDPSLEIRDFPHRGFGYGHQQGSRTTDSEVDVEGAESGEPEVPATVRGGRTDKPRAVTVRERQINVLVQSIHQFLDRGEIAKAARAYGLVLQLRPRGLPIDIRHYNLWAIGAEILMRDGETPSSEASVGDVVNAPGHSSMRQARWGYATNMNKVKAYFETLIQRYPYDYRMPHKISAVDFQLAMLSCEIYNAHAEHVISLRHLGAESQDWDEDTDAAMADDDGDDDLVDDPRQRREARLNGLKDEARKRALAAMRDIAARMDNIAKTQPFPKNQSFLKLRATASLYMADLAVPIAPVSELATREGQEHRHSELKTARTVLGVVRELGGDLDRTALAFLGVEDEEASSLDVPVYPSLPIRQA